MNLYTDEYESLTIFAKKTADIGVLNIDGVGSYSFRYINGSHITVTLESNHNYCITWSNLRIVFAYLHEGTHSPAIKIVYPKKENLQYRYHFSPPVGWMNDPNGLCFYHGKFHIFYQFNPMDTIWGNPYWGHAQSQDLLHWEHLPVALSPQIELLNLNECRGGAYSGTALIENENMHLFFTRHIGDNARTWCMELPWTTVSQDGITFESETNCISNLPPELDSNCRDPKVIKYGKEWLMLMGTRERISQTPAISIHTSTDLIHWSYKGIFFKEENPKYIQAECPDIISIGKDKYLLMIGYHNRPEATNQIRRDTICYQGYIKDYQFIEERKFILDYGKDFYASQSFVGIQKHILIGWINDMAQSFIKNETNVNGVMSLPREISIHEQMIRTFPIVQVKSLFEKELPSSSKYETNGSYHLILDSPAKVTLASSEKGDASIELKDNGVCIINIFDDNFECKENTSKVDAFFDIEVLEIFLDEGRYSYSRRFCCKHPSYTVTVCNGNIDGVHLRPYKI